MARKPANSPVTLSVFDRLIDQDPKVRAEAAPTRQQSLRELKAALRRDLEWLLNTRQPLDAPPEGATELPHSLCAYGLPDITSMGVSSLEDRKKAIPMIPRVARPRKDPVYGKDGPLMGIWRQPNHRQS